jgi:DNA polymerase-3 subunit gamma/tau
VLLTLKPELRHLNSDKTRHDLANIISQVQGQPVQVEVVFGAIAGRETPLEIEQRRYIDVREQIRRDLHADPIVQCLTERFAAVLHDESIEPLSR